MTEPSQPVRPRPVFITLDGIDGVGKTTQMDRLTAHLQTLGHEVLLVHDPGSTPIGAKLRELLLESDLELHRRTEAMLFMASRCEMIEKTIRPAIGLQSTASLTFTPLSSTVTTDPSEMIVY